MGAPCQFPFYHNIILLLFFAQDILWYFYCSIKYHGIHKFLLYFSFLHYLPYHICTKASITAFYLFWRQYFNTVHQRSYASFFLIAILLDSSPLLPSILAFLLLTISRENSSFTPENLRCYRFSSQMKNFSLALCLTTKRRHALCLSFLAAQHRRFIEQVCQTAIPVSHL